MRDICTQFRLKMQHEADNGKQLHFKTIFSLQCM